MMGRQNQQFSKLFTMPGLDTVVIKKLPRHCTNTLYTHWGRDVTATKARLHAKKIFEAAVEDFAGPKKPVELLHMLAERVPWTVPVPNDAILTLFDTIVRERANYLQKQHERPKRLETAFIVVFQRYIDLSSGTEKPNSTDGAWKRAEPPSMEEQQLLVEEATQEEARRQEEQEQNEYNDEDELKENVDYPAYEDAGEHTSETDPYAYVYDTEPDPRKPQKSTSSRSKDKAASSKKVTGKSAPKNIFQDFFKGVDAPVIIPIPPLSDKEIARRGTRTVSIKTKPPFTPGLSCHEPKKVIGNKGSNTKLPTNDNTFVFPIRLKKPVGFAPQTNRPQVDVHNPLHVTNGGNPIATQIFRSRFIGGRYQLIHTSGYGLLCGLQAIVHSFRAQVGGTGVQPTIRDLQRATQTDEALQFNWELRQEARYNNDNYFADQLGAALRSWGLAQVRPLHLQLGYILSDGSAYLVPGPEHPDTIVVWIHSTSSTSTRGNCLHHFSGIRHH